MDVEARRYRFRLLNGSDSAFYTMSVTTPAAPTQSAIPIWQIGTDDRLLNAPVKAGQLTQAPGERADVIVDFTKFKPGTWFILSNSAPTPFPAEAKVLAGLTDRIMAFDVVVATGVDTSLPHKDLVNLNRTDPVPAPAVVARTRDIALYETLDEFGRITPLMGTPANSYEFLDPITVNSTSATRRCGGSTTTPPTATRSTCTRCRTRSSRARRSARS